MPTQPYIETNRPPAVEYLPGRGGRSIEPQEPCLHNRADENLKWISELEHRLGRIDAYLFGERPEDANKRPPAADSLEAKIADAGTRLACLVGSASTILGKLTGSAG